MRACCDGYDSNIAIPPVVSSKDAHVLPAAREVSSIAESHRCFHCSEAFSNDLGRVVHIEHTHQGKLYYPTPEDFENRLRPN